MAGEASRSAAELERCAADLEADLQALDAQAADCAEQRDALAADPGDRGAAAILALGMHAYYTGVESAIERVERLLATPPPPGPTWHRELLWGAARPIGDARPAILSLETVRGLDRLRTFRHFLRHAYGVPLETVELLRTEGFLAATHPRLRAEVEELALLLRRMAVALEDG